MSKRILIVLSEWGSRGEDLLGPLGTFDAAGHEAGSGLRRWGFHAEAA